MRSIGCGARCVIPVEPRTDSVAFQNFAKEVVLIGLKLVAVIAFLVHIY